MTINIYDYKDTKSYLLAVLGDKAQRKGAKSQAAKFLDCHPTVISQILSGKIQVNLEQAEKLNRFLGHGESDAHYFLLLVQNERAGTHHLRDYFKKQLEEIRAKRLVIKQRIGATAAVSKEDEQKYYSSWIYAALHVALTIPELRSADALAKHFRCSLSQIQDALAFLTKAGLVVQSQKEFNIGPKHIHLGANSNQIQNHHRNWRLKAIQTFDEVRTSDLHYSSAVTLSREDVLVVKDKLIEYLKSLNKTIAASKEEETYALNFDFFKI